MTMMKNIWKIKFSSDDELSLPSMITVVRAASRENNKYYPKVFLDENYEQYKNAIY